MKVILMLGVSFLLMSVETWLKGIVPVSGLLAVVSMACVIKLRSTEFVSRRLSEKFGKLWLAAEVILFVLVGAAVNIRYTLQAGAVSLLMLAVSLWRFVPSVCSAACWVRSLPDGNGFSVFSLTCQKQPCRQPSAQFRYRWSFPAASWFSLSLFLRY